MPDCGSTLWVPASSLPRPSTMATAVAPAAAPAVPKNNAQALEPRVARRFDVQSVLGKGAFATIYKAKDKTCVIFV